MNAAANMATITVALCGAAPRADKLRPHQEERVIAKSVRTDPGAVVKSNIVADAGALPHRDVRIGAEVAADRDLGTDVNIGVDDAISPDSRIVFDNHERANARVGTDPGARRDAENSGSDDDGEVFVTPRIFCASEEPSV